MSNGIKDKLLGYKSQSEFETISIMAMIAMIEDGKDVKESMTKINNKVEKLEMKMYAIMLIGGGAWSVGLLIIEKIFF